MKPNKWRRLCLIAGLLAAGLQAVPARADAYPAKPIKLIVTFVPGGGALGQSG